MTNNYNEYKYAPYPYAMADIILGCEIDGTKILKIKLPASGLVLNLELNEDQFKSALKAIKVEAEKYKDVQ